MCKAGIVAPINIVPIDVYTDGGCYNVAGTEERGVGAWAFVEYNIAGSMQIFTGYEEDTTNNRTEMLAVINAIKHYPQGSKINIISDSGYVVKGYTHPSYLDKWVKSGWKTSSGNDVKNQDLWTQILTLSYHYALTFTLIKGHNKDGDRIHALWNAFVDAACSKTMHAHQSGTYRTDTVLGGK